MGSVRYAVKEDLASINEIYNWAVLNTTATFDLEARSVAEAERWFNSHQDARYPLIVLEIDGQVVGWGSLSPYHPRPAYRFTGEFSVYLAPEFRGQGLGSELLAFLCREAVTLGYHSLIGLITADNRASLRLAAKFGFTPAGHYQEVGYKFAQWLDLVTVQKILIKN